MEALFDIKVIDTDAPHRNCSPEAIPETGAIEKKRVYEQTVVEQRGNFSPIVLSVDGLLHRREAEHFLKRIPGSQMGKYLFETCGMLGPDWPFAIIRVAPFFSSKRPCF